MRRLDTEKTRTHSWPWWTHCLFFLEKDATSVQVTMMAGSCTPTWLALPASPFSTCLFVFGELKRVLSSHATNDAEGESATNIN